MMDEHGGNIRLYPGMLDYSANINPLGMPQAVQEAAESAVKNCTQYPDPHCTALTEKLAAFHGISPSQIVCGNGAADLIYRIVYALRPKHALIPAPTFSEYEKALRETGCKILVYSLKESRSFEYDTNIVNELENGADMLFLCNPNNPTGKLISPSLLEQISYICKTKHIMLVCDESFIEFCEAAEKNSLKQYFHENCIIIKAFTKIFAMPGLRLGYLLCADETYANTIRNTGQYWSVSMPAQAAGIAALGQKQYIKQTVAFIKQERQYLELNLRRMHISFFPSDVNFMLLKAAPDFAVFMIQNGIIVRQCSNFRGLDDHFFRIAVRTHEENAALIAAAERYQQWQKQL